MSARERVERTTDPDRFGDPELARSIAERAEAMGRHDGHPPTELGVEEVIETLAQFAFALRTALLELADEIDGLQKTH
jgi:hypothetical protein